MCSVTLELAHPLALDVVRIAMDVPGFMSFHVLPPSVLT
jgi:hypothetical protein